MSIRQVKVYRCEDGKDFDELQDAQMHHQKIIADSKLSDFIVNECRDLASFDSTDDLVSFVRKINEHFVVFSRNEGIDLDALETSLCLNRGELPPTMNTLTQLIMKQEESK